MHCKACDEVLTNCEATNKTESGEYPDLCNVCLEDIRGDIKIVENPLCSDVTQATPVLFDHSTKGNQRA